MEGIATLKVTENLLAPALKTGTVRVMSTAAMAALMEEAACNALAKVGTNGKAHVGVSLELKHKKPSAIGANVKAVAKLCKSDNKKYNFDIEVFDETGLVGSAKHTRVAVDQQSFEDRCNENARKARKQTK